MTTGSVSRRPRPRNYYFTDEDRQNLKKGVPVSKTTAYSRAKSFMKNFGEILLQKKYHCIKISGVCA